MAGGPKLATTTTFLSLLAMTCCSFTKTTQTQSIIEPAVIIKKNRKPASFFKNKVPSVPRLCCPEDASVNSCCRFPQPACEPGGGCPRGRVTAEMWCPKSFRNDRAQPSLFARRSDSMHTILSAVQRTQPRPAGDLSQPLPDKCSQSHPPRLMSS